MIAKKLLIILRLLWLIFLLIAILITLVSYKADKIETNILDILPELNDSVIRSAHQEISKNLDQQLVLVFNFLDDDSIKIKESLSYINSSLEASGLFKRIESSIDLDKANSLYNTLFPYRLQLVSLGQDYLKSDSISSYIEEGKKQLYGFSDLNQDQFFSDPLFLFQNYLNHIFQSVGKGLKIKNNAISVSKQEKDFYFIFLTLNSSPYEPTYQKEVTSLIDNLKINLDNVNFYKFGVIFYAKSGYDLANNEIKQISLISTIGLILLFLYFFSSFRPLIVSLFIIASSLIVSFGFCILLFNKIHVLTILFSTTIIGVAIDYCFHTYVASVAFKSEKLFIIKLARTMLIALLTSSFAYLSFALTGIALLKEVAVMSILGIILTYISSLLIIPISYSASLNTTNRLSSLSVLFFTKLSGLFNKKYLIHLALILVVSCFVINPNDNVQSMQPLNVVLKQQENKVRELLSFPSYESYLVIKKQYIDEVLQIEELIRPIMSNLLPQNYLLLSDIFPDQKQQMINYKNHQLLYSHSLFDNYIESLGVLKSDFDTNDPLKHIDYGEWINNNHLSTLWSGRLFQIDNDYYSIIPLISSELTESQTDFLKKNEVKLVNLTGSISDAFKSFRIKMTIILAFMIALITLIAFIRYGIHGIRMICCPVISGLFSIIVIFIMGYPISIFNILALILLVGMGIDYVIFMKESESPKSIYIALVLSCFTTVLSFGFLGLSNTPALSSFGLTVAVGIVVMLILAPTAIFKEEK